MIGLDCLDQEAAARMSGHDVARLEGLELGHDLGRARALVIEHVVAVPAGTAEAHLHQPRPHRRDRCRDGDAARLARRRLRDQVVTGQWQLALLRFDAPVAQARPDDGEVGNRQ
jgi:hypothetical protein